MSGTRKWVVQDDNQEHTMTSSSSSLCTDMAYGHCTSNYDDDVIMCPWSQPQGPASRHTKWPEAGPRDYASRNRFILEAIRAGVGLGLGPRLGKQCSCIPIIHVTGQDLGSRAHRVCTTTAAKNARRPNPTQCLRAILSLHCAAVQLVSSRTSEG